MKFSQSLKFNSVPEWSEYYISYSQLKKKIYQIRDAVQLEAQTAKTSEQATPITIQSALNLTVEMPLLSEVAVSKQLEEKFVFALDSDLNKICDFFTKKNVEFIGNFQNLMQNFSVEDNNLERMETGTRRRTLSWSGGRRRVGWTGDDSIQKKEDFKKTAIQVFLDLHSLKEYLELNYTGFSKVLKKHDKNTPFKLKDKYLAKAEIILPFKELDELKSSIEKLENHYAFILYDGHRHLALTELKHFLKDQIVFERNTIWKDMIEQERRMATIVTVPTKDNQIPKGLIIRHRKLISLLLSTIIFFICLKVQVFEETTVQNCFALFVFTSLLWSLEVFPLFVPSLLIPFLVVVLQVLRDGNTKLPLNPAAAAKTIFQAMFSQVIMLLLGGFALAAALSKYNIARSLAITILSKSGTNPNVVLLVNMIVATFASMWISNVAAPVLCFSLVHPIIRTMETGSVYAKATIMGITLAANIGGMASPISSPQNVFAIEKMITGPNPPNWLHWLAISIPLCAVSVLMCWAILLFAYKPAKQVSEIHPLRPTEEKYTFKQYYVIFISIMTIALWCMNSFLSKYTGEMGILAAFPLVGFFGTGILSKEDFNNFLWSVVMLAMGGLAMGEAVKSSGLLLVIGNGIRNAIDHYSVWVIVIIFCFVVLVITTFISHTVGAFIILPIVQEIGEHLPEPRARLLIMAAALTCSAGMGLPISSFPNMNAINLEDPTGQNYVTTKDFLKVGIPSSVAVYVGIISIGYGLMILVGF